MSDPTDEDLEIHPMTTPHCIVCKETLSTDPAKTYMVGDQSDSRTLYPVCVACWTSGAYEKWRIAALDAVMRVSNMGVAFSSVGNLLLDYITAQAYLTHQSRIDDGVCPNGCSLLLHIEGNNRECPVCHFVAHSTTS